ncbi:MAG: DUF4350 domain-containing protein, partial [Vulcanimicrobiaceae bacterium]
MTRAARYLREQWREVALLAFALVLLTALALAERSQNPLARLPSYSSLDAGTGGYRAWAELLAREGIRVTRFEQHAAFLGSDTATLVWAQPLVPVSAAGAPTRADFGALAQWVRAGGTLVFVGSRSPAYAPLGIPKTVFARRANFEPLVAPVLARFGVQRVAAGGRERFATTRGVRVLLADAAGPLVVERHVGRGRTLAVVDPSLFANERIALADNARLALALALIGPRGTLAFDEAIHGELVPERWWQALPRALLVALAIAALAVLLALVAGAIRLGPAVPEAAAEPRPAALIEALADLYRRSGRAPAALALAER